MKKKYYKPSLEDHLTEIFKQSQKKTLTLGELSCLLHGKTRPIIILFLSLPFCLFLPIPGLSTPFGLAIMFFSLRILFGKKTFIPKRLLGKKISKKLLKKMIKYGLWLLKKIQPLIHPRLFWVFHKPFLFLPEIILIIMGFFFALPLPIPASNFVPAWSIFLTTLGMIEEDGVCVLFGVAVGFSLIFLVLLLLLIG